MKAKTTYLLHPLFLVSLCLLAMNDWYLKPALSNWMTGKLSDIAGLIAFTLFLFQLLPAKRKAVIVFVCFFFAWWKSPLSGPVILFIQQQFSLPVNRVVDYTDLIGLLPLPFLIGLKPVSYRAKWVQQLAVYTIGIVSFTCFTATSIARHIGMDNRVRVEKNITTRKSEEAILKTLEVRGLQPRTDTPIYSWTSSYQHYTRIGDSTGRYAMVAVDSLKGFSGLYEKINYGTPVTIPQFVFNEDTLYNLQFILSQHTTKKKNIRIHSFSLSDTTAGAQYRHNYRAKKVKKSLKKWFKKTLK